MLSVPPEVNGGLVDSPQLDRAAVAAPAQVDSAGPFANFDEPFKTYATLLIAADDAAKRLWQAQVTGNVTEVRDAELDRADALTALERYRHHGASVFLMCARFAAELFPGSLQAILDPAFRRELDCTQNSVRDCEERIGDVEDAVVRIELGEGVSA